MKAITLHQPWATLIALGVKKFETRSWTTAHRGLLAIHAGKTVIYSPRDMPEIASILDRFNISANHLPTGKVLAICDLKTIFHTEDVRNYLSSDELACGDFRDGRAAWQLSLVEVLNPPVAASGKQGLWEWKAG